MLVYEKGGVIKHVEAPAINKVELLDCEKMELVTIWNRVKYLITDCSTNSMSVFHYDITVFDHTKCVIPDRHTFGLLSHLGRLGGGGLRRKSPLDGATDLLSKT